MKTALFLIRTRCNYSQVFLATVLGVSRQVISAWENGRKKLPDHRAKELAGLFGVPLTLLTQQNPDDVERWCNRPLFPRLIQGRQVFSFEPAEQSPQVVVLPPDAPMPADKSRELVACRNRMLKNIAEVTAIRQGRQVEDLSYAEPCISILEQILEIFRTAGETDGICRQMMLTFLREQISLSRYVLCGIEPESTPSQWQIQQIQMLRAHWAASIRKHNAAQEVHPLTQEDISPYSSLSERITLYYRQALDLGVNTQDLQYYLEKIMMEEHPNDKN